MEAFQQRLWEMFSVRFHGNLTLPQLDRVRWHLFPEIRLPGIRAVERGQIPPAQYEAVLIDEGHDFRPEWLKLVVQMVDPHSNSLLVLYDDAQSIYEAGRQKNFSFKSVGIQAQDTVKLLPFHSSKGLEYPIIVIPGAGLLPTQDKATEEDARLLYVAMTRATSQLIVTEAHNA